MTDNFKVGRYKPAIPMNSQVKRIVLWFRLSRVSDFIMEVIIPFSILSVTFHSSNHHNTIHYIDFIC